MVNDACSKRGSRVFPAARAVIIAGAAVLAALLALPAHAKLSDERRQASEAAARASAAEAKAWQDYNKKIDHVSGAIKGLDKTARAARYSPNAAVRAGGYAYRAGRAAGDLGVAAVKKAKKRQVSNKPKRVRTFRFADWTPAAAETCRYSAGPANGRCAV